MSILMVLLFGLVLWRIQIKPSGVFKDYLAQDNTQSIKGVFLLLVFMSHFSQYIELDSAWDSAYISIRRFLGQLIVVPFLFYSGYGIAESVKKKGSVYVKAMPIKRIAKVLFQFAVAVLIFVVIQAVRGNRYPVKRILLSLIGWDGIGNSNWYVLAILVLYSLTFLSFAAFSALEMSRKKQTLVYFSLTLLTLLFIFFMYYRRDGYWYNTVYAYVAGCWYSLFKPHVDELLEKCGNGGYVFLTLIVLGTFMMAHKLWSHIVSYELTAVLFALVVILVSMKVRPRNRFLIYCGENLFSLYILQRLPMLCLQNTMIGQYRYLYFFVCLAVTLMLGAIFDRILPLMWSPVEQLLSLMQVKWISKIRKG